MNAIKNPLAIPVVCLVLSSTVSGQSIQAPPPRIVNLDAQPIHVARAHYSKGDAPTSSNGTSKLMWYDGPGWEFSGWLIVQPGQAVNIEEDFYYIEQNGRELSIPSTYPKAFPGLVSSAQFAEKLNDDRRAEDTRRLQGIGFRNATFRKLEKGNTYPINGGTPRFDLISRQATIQRKGYGSFNEIVRDSAPVAGVNLRIERRDELKGVKFYADGSNVVLKLDLGSRDDGTKWPGEIVATVFYSIIVPRQQNPVSTAGQVLNPTGQPSPQLPAPLNVNEPTQLPPPLTDVAANPPGQYSVQLPPPLTPSYPPEQQLPPPLTVEKLYQPRLGINVLPGSDGVVVTAITGELARSIGLQVQDQILTINARSVRSAEEVIRVLREAAIHADGQFEITLERGQKLFRISSQLLRD